MKEKLFFIAVLSIIVCGAVFRIGQYAYNRSLTEGEAPLAMNILERSYAELARPLSYVQAAPVGFLYVQKFMATAFGSGEYGMRLIPLIAGILALVLFYFAGRHILNKNALLIALALFAVNDHLIYFASELKQYSTDVLCAVGLLLAGLWAMRKEGGALRLLIFGLLSGVAIWFSHSSLFVGAAMLGVMAFSIRRDRRDRKILWLASAAFALTGWIANFLLVLAAQRSQSGLLEFWRHGFMPLPPRSLSDFGWIAYAVARIFKNPGGHSAYDALIAAVLCGTGLAVIFRNKTRHAFVLVLPILLALLASGLRVYPFEGRLLLFLAPFLAVMIAAGADAVREAIGKTSRAGGVFVAVIILAYPAGSALYRLARPRAPEELRPVMAELQSRRSPDQAVYVYYGAVNAFKFYAARYGFGPDDYVQGIEARNDWPRYYADLKNLARSGRGNAWIVMSHISTWHGVDEEKLFCSYLNLLGDITDVIPGSGAAAYLCDFSRTSEDNSDR